MTKYFIAWNEDKTEGFITDDEDDAQQACSAENKNGAWAALGLAFFETYGEQDCSLQEVEIQTFRDQPLPNQDELRARILELVNEATSAGVDDDS